MICSRCAPLGPQRDWGKEAHDVAVAHLDACDEWLAYFDEGEPENERPSGDDPSSAPYCGCQVCLVREVLYASWSVIEEAVRSGDFDPCTQCGVEQLEATRHVAVTGVERA